MRSKNSPNSPLRLLIAHRFFTVLDRYVINVIDTLLFLWYALQNNVQKHQKKVEIKKAHNIKRGTGKTEFVDETLNNLIKDIKAHHEKTPFFLRLIPTLVLCAIIWLTL